MILINKSNVFLNCFRTEVPKKRELLKKLLFVVVVVVWSTFMRDKETDAFVGLSFDLIIFKVNVGVTQEPFKPKVCSVSLDARNMAPTLSLSLSLISLVYHFLLVPLSISLKLFN